MKPINFTNHKIASQKFEKSYFDVGGLSVFDPKTLNVLIVKIFLINLVAMNKNLSKSIDIDDHEDWKFAEKLFEK